MDIPRISIEIPLMHLRLLWWWKRDTEGIEVFSGILAWSFAGLLFLPTQVFTTQAYRYHAAIAPEDVWAFCFAVLALFQSLAMCGNVNVFRRPSVIMGIILWGSSAGMFFWANPYGIAFAFFGLLAGGNLWALLRHAKGEPNVG